MGEFWGVLERYFPEFVSGFFVTLRLVGISFAIAMSVGVVIAAFRVTPAKWVQRIGGTYVEIFRNIPLLVLLFILFYGLPSEVQFSRVTAGALGLGLYTAAYVGEAVRSGVFAVGQGQIDASLSLGFSYRDTLRRVVLPQAVRTVIPPLGSLFIAMTKNSAVIGGALQVQDLMMKARGISADTFQTNEAFFWAAVGYLLITVSLTFVVRNLETRLAIRR
ncbi:MAG: amino acid ABC transporter permease [Actinobacteria bacterium]|nr:amino acid ABC transporter permease [Actinomycetota bacterium]